MEQKTHYKRLQHPDYLGAYALDPGKDLIVTIKEVKNEMITGSDGKKEECVVAHFSAPVGTKPMILNSTNLKQIAKLFNSPYVEDWAGKAIQLYTTPVKAFGEVVEALRVRPMAPQVTKPKLSDMAKAKAAIAAGQITIEAIKSRYDLTPEQLTELTNA